MSDKPNSGTGTADADPAVRIFTPKTRFHTMARRPGGVAREHAIESAQAAIDEAKVGFDDWLEQELQALIGLVGHARSGKANSGWVEVAQIHCNQLRDVGGTVGFELLTFVAGTLCTIFDSIRAGAPCNMDSITCHLDALLLIRQKEYRNLRPDEVPELSGGLFRIAESVSIVPGSDPK